MRGLSGRLFGHSHHTWRREAALQVERLASGYRLQPYHISSSGLSPSIWHKVVWSIIRKRRILSLVYCSCGNITPTGEYCIRCDKKNKPFTCADWQEPLSYYGYAKPGKNDLFYGVELEAIVRRPYSNFNLGPLGERIWGWATPRTDGSIHSVSAGIELVTLPLSLAAHKRAWRLLFPEGETTPLIRAHGSCGMHVHINAAAVRRQTALKMYHFLNRSFEETLVFSGRSRSRMEEWSDRAYVGWSHRLPSTIAGHKYTMMHATRYGTYEIRVFASTSSYSRVIANLEFCEAMITYADGEAFGQMTWPGFLRHATRYPNLCHALRNCPPPPDYE